MRISVRPFATVVICAAVLAAGLSVSARQQAVGRTLVDVVAVDRDGRSVDDLAARDFSAAVDGQPRHVVSVTHVSRGAGAESTALSRQANASTSAFAAESSRLVLLVVDEAMLGRGDERSALQAANAFLDRLGLDDRVAIVRLPMTAATRVVSSTDRPAVREALAAAVAQVTARAATASADDKARADAPDRPVVDPDRVAGGDPDRTASGDRPALQAAAEAPPPIPDDDTEKVRATLGGLGNLLSAVRPVPGRKVVALFSAGIPSAVRSGPADLDGVAIAAAGARAVIHVFGLRLSDLDARSAADLQPLEKLAQKTGGSGVMLDKDPTKGVDRVVQQLSACYVIEMESVPGDANGRPHAVRIDTSRKGVTLRVPSALVVRPDPDERLVTIERAPDALRAAPAVEKRESPREFETEVALSRMTAYVQGYQRAFSGLVAEEDYSQQIKGREARLRSDFLLVKLETGDYWVSFRDVFEADGKPVRDREERLKKLFLDNPTAEAMIQVRKIQDESTRLNIGPVQRNFNVPLYALTLLLPENRPRFHFTLADKTTSNGLQVWKLEYEERVRPTLIKNPRTNADVPAKGYFLMDPASGAIIESSLDAQEASVTGRFVVRFRSDASLGLWVPAEMNEMYTLRPSQELVMGGKATYTNFRRFQVKTEEKVTIPKLP